MSANPSPYDAAIEQLEGQIRHLQSILDSLKVLRTAPDGSPLVFSSGASRDADVEIRHDTFFAMTIADAVRKYLGMVKVTKSTADIAAALERGGLKHSSKDFSTTVRSILGQQREVFTRVPNGDWGLNEWYPGQGRGKKVKGEKPRKKAPPKRSRAKKAESNVPIQTANTASGDAALKPGVRVKAYMESHPGATPHQIADALGITFRVVKVILGKKVKSAG